MARFATIDDFEQINEIRKQVSDLHVNGRPDIFKPGFCEEMKNYIHIALRDENYGILVSEQNKLLTGFLFFHVIIKEESPYNLPRKFLKVEEIGVREGFQRNGIGLELMNALNTEAQRIGISKIELDVWSFNDNALSFYEAIGFTTYRRMMEFDVTPEVINPYDRYIEGRYPVLDYDHVGTPVVDPVKFLKDSQYPYNKLIITFFPEVMNKLIEEEQISLYDTIRGENPVLVYKFKDNDILITLGQVGCPACAGNLDCFYGLGIRKVIFCGGGGVLDKTIPVGTPLVVTGAIRDEGLSYQYIAPSRIVYSDEKIVQKICDFMDSKGVPHISGLVWTTDAMMRETPERVKRRRAEGAQIVEMEQAGCLAVAKYRNLDYGAIIYGGDDVSGTEWDERGWSLRGGIRYSLVLLCKDIIETF